MGEEHHTSAEKDTDDTKDKIEPELLLHDGFYNTHDAVNTDEDDNEIACVQECEQRSRHQ